ncbi:NosD domain-containing protein [Chloroflexota bacterium]
MGKSLFMVAIILSLVMIMIPAEAVMAATITVDDDGPADFTTIQAAIDAAASGDTIMVMPGTYNEWLTISKPLTLQGFDKNTTILQASSISSLNGIDVNVTHDVNISGFTVKGYRSGVCLRDTNNAHITDNIFQDNDGPLATDYSGVEFVSNVTYSNISGNIFTGNEYGIILRNGSDNNVIDGNTLTYNEQTAIYLNSSSGNQIINNSAEYNNNGVHLAYNANNNTIENNILSNNNAQGVRIEISSYNSVTNNTVENNVWNGVFLFTTANNNTIANNDIIGNDMRGVFINTNSENNTIVGNTISGNSKEGIYLYQNVTNTEIYYNTIENNGKGMYLLAAHYTKVYNNNFINNVYYWQAESQSSAGVELSLPAPVGGNYWSNHTSPDNDNDGFVDNPYSIPMVATDHLPWASPNGWLTQSNQPPEAVIDTEMEVYEGTEGGPAVVFNAHESSDPDGDTLTYRWDFNNDGIWDTGYLTDAGYAYVYPDDYTGLVVLEVSDGEFTDTDTCEALIDNVPPVVDMLADELYPSPPIFVSVGEAAHIFAAFKDVPTDTHTYIWDFGDGESEPGVVPEPEPSPPIINTDHIYTSASIYHVTITVTDDDGSIGQDWIDVIVSAGDTEMRTIGFWKHQIGGGGKQHVDDSILEVYINFIDFKSKVFSEKTPLGGLADAESLLWLKKATMEQRATQQLLATWLNVANGAAGMDDIVDTDYDGNVDMKLKDAIKLAENIILSVAGDYEQAKNICDSINNM